MDASLSACTFFIPYFRLVDFLFHFLAFWRAWSDFQVLHHLQTSQTDQSLICFDQISKILTNRRMQLNDPQSVLVKLPIFHWIILNCFLIRFPISSPSDSNWTILSNHISLNLFWSDFPVLHLQTSQTEGSSICFDQASKIFTYRRV